MSVIFNRQGINVNIAYNGCCKCTQRDKLKLVYQVGDGTDEAANRDALDKVSGDRAFTCPTLELSDSFDSAGLRTYFYHLTHRASNEVWPPWMGVIHGAEIQVRHITHYQLYHTAQGSAATSLGVVGS